VVADCLQLAKLISRLRANGEVDQLSDSLGLVHTVKDELEGLAGHRDGYGTAVAPQDLALGLDGDVS